MKDKNIVVIVLVAVLVLVFGVSGFLLFRGISQFSAAEKSVKRSVATLRNYYARDPFPSSENVAREAENGKVLRRWLAALSVSLREGQVEPIQKTPSNFIRLFSEKREQLRDLAQKHHAVLPDDFAIGFERYSASGALPAPLDVPRLAQQLVVAEQLCRVLFENGAASLTTLRREEFESAGPTGIGAAAPSRSSRSAHGRHRAPVATSAPVEERAWKVTHDAGELKDGALYARLRFGLTFEAREEAVMGIMNQLAVHDMFAVVTLLQIEKVIDDVVAPGSEDGEKQADAMVAPTGYPPRSQRMMSGAALERPRRITMEVDVYRFAELTSGKGA